MNVKATLAALGIFVCVGAVPANAAKHWQPVYRLQKTQLQKSTDLGSSVPLKTSKLSSVTRNPISVKEVKLQPYRSDKSIRGGKRRPINVHNRLGSTTGSGRLPSVRSVKAVPLSTRHRGR